jgi:glutathione synthase/RimK-type ligase-like ATP-grasp enzyme
VSKIAIATCGGENVDPDSPLLLTALANEGHDALLCVWDDPVVDWDSYELTVIRSTWDYASRREEFLLWARDVPRLWNPYEVVRYSSDKHYLGDMATRGHRVVTSFFCDVGTSPQFPKADFVVKPTVGAGSMDAARYKAYETEGASAHVERLHAQGRDVLIQPYITSVDEVGERALVFIDGEFSHAMTKAAMLNVSDLDRNKIFRWEQMSVAVAEPDAIVFAEAVLAGLDFKDLLYSRVDIVDTPEGWALMELELVEPSLFLYFEPAAAAKLARAISARI